MVTKVLSLKGKEPSFICDCVQGEISAKALYYSVSQKHKKFLNSKNVTLKKFYCYILDVLFNSPNQKRMPKVEHINPRE